MFKAIGRYFKAIGYFFTGKFDRARKELSKSPYVVQATYDNVVEEKTKRIQQYKEAVGGLIAQQEKKMTTVKRLTEEVSKLERMKAGAAAKAQAVVAQLQGEGLTQEQMKQNEEYQRCLTAFNDFSTTLNEKNDRIAELEGDINEADTNIANHKLQLQQLLRDVDKLKTEAADTVADMITAKEEEELADMISGISEDTTAKELQDMRDLRAQQKAQARISREVAGTDTKQQEAEFLEYARAGTASDEFEKLVGLAKEADTGAAEEAKEEEPSEQDGTKLPES